MLHYRWCSIAKRNTADKMGNETAQRFADALDAEMTKHGFLGIRRRFPRSRKSKPPADRFGNYCICFHVTEDETIIVRILCTVIRNTSLSRATIGAYCTSMLRPVEVVDGSMRRELVIARLAEFADLASQWA